MATYDAMDTDTAATADDDKKTISFRFCRECSNMLYPKENTEDQSLMFSCRMCTYSEPAESACVYKNALKEEIAETPGETEDVDDDPTVGEDESLDYAYDSVMDNEDLYGEETVPEMCTLCGKEILCPFCGGPSANGIVLEAPEPRYSHLKQTEEEQVESERRERALSGAGLLNS
ncbi:hypothetical protein LTR62_002938 [Meristemomyces frigidus]|uniref:DNA-directed RNA polymerase II subunit RPB9-like zinc ribbon domain-containing protein n=1 Tax=Meristemomyces frigidus TaxID=1508187 RepID=A0AAN7TJT3_9PEZI|nr:hypothetical protein LTR62_002938 [Meristemomyces frigidus]